MKRLLAAFACMAIALSCIVPAALAFGADDEKNGDPLTVGVPTNRCPVFYKEEGTGEIVGIGVDLMRTAAEEAGYAPTFVDIGEPTLKDALDNDAYDVLMPFGSAIDSASGQASIVSDNLTQTPFTLVTAGNRSLPPLENLKVGMVRSLGGVAETVKQLYPGVEIAMYDTMDDSVKALRGDQIDALLNNSYVWSYVLQKPSYADLKVQPSAMFSMDFRAGTLDTPDGRATIERLNKGIATLTDTRRQAIVLDYTTRRLYRYDFSDFLFQYGAGAILVGLLLVALFVIIAQRRRANQLEQEEKMRRLIDHDALTGALSLTGFRKRVEEVLRTHPDVPYILSYNNITNFKYINESFGRDVGDDLLRFWVRESQKTFSDDELMGRVEADHFTVLRHASNEKIKFDDENVFEPLRNYLINRGKETQVQVCSGIYALTPEDYQDIDVDRMLDCARVAEKRLRETHKDGFGLYNPDQWEKGRLSADVVSHLPLAIQSGEIQVWYQPQMNYETGEIIGAEALCRWKHGKLGWLSPAVFIPILEKSDLVYDLDCFVWEKACQDLARWNEQGIRRSVSVNLSRRDIRAGVDIPNHFDQLIEAHGLTHDQLRIEVTESAFVKDQDPLIEATVKLRELGFMVEMDDFGSGYSSLHMLKEVPVDCIKLDLHFLTGSGDPEKGRIVMSYMVQMVRALGMDLIAEGVETVDQADFLQSRGCSVMQGFYFHKPMPVEDFEKLDGFEAPQAR